MDHFNPEDEIWCITLWELQTKFVENYGFEGNDQGYSAQSPNGDLPSGVVENFDMPNECL